MWRTLSLLFILPVLLLSCNGGSYVPCNTDTYHFADTSQFVSFDMNIELPADSDGIYADIRSSIIEKLIGQMASLGSYEEPHVIRPYDGNPDDILALLSHYGSHEFNFLEELAIDDDEERSKYSDFHPAWDCSFSVSLISESRSYVVFDSRSYLYMGGAHGGVTGAGQLTYSKTDGRLVESFLLPDCVEPLQPALKEGLLSYFADDGYETADDMMEFLFLGEDSIITLPAWAPYPTSEGLVFTYQQYEIAPYAAGMPSFTVPYAKLKKYMTDEARRLCR